MIRTLSLLAFVGATACGGGSSGASFTQAELDTVRPPVVTPTPRPVIVTPTPEPVVVTPPPDPEPEVMLEPEPELNPTELELFNASVNDFNTRADAIGFVDLGLTPDAMVQPTGGADFAGFMSVDVNLFDKFAADVALSLDFDTNTITASHGQFYHDNGFGDVVPYDGELRLIRGTIGESAPNDLDLDVRGTLRNGEDRLRLNVDLTGGFLGNDSEALGLVSPLLLPDSSTIAFGGLETGRSSVSITALPVTD